MGRREIIRCGHAQRALTSPSTTRHVARPLKAPFVTTTSTVDASVDFASLGVPADITERLARDGVTHPFPIQAASLPDALAGLDVCGRAPTGSGKTLAFGIPLVHRVPKAKPRRPTALVLVPTRELAAQIERALTPLAKLRGRTVATFYGGVGFGPQLSALRKGCDIAVACPGRLADLVQQGEIRLDDVSIAVIDEADRMADMGFLPEVRRLLDRVRRDRQTLLFSATLDGDVDVLIKRYQSSPVRHEVAAPDDGSTTHHVFWHLSRDQRVGVVAGLAERHYSTIVFCRTKRGADRVAKQLGQRGITAAAIHGDRSQAQRDRALAAFTDGKVQALIATDVAARGIHVDDVGCVIHYDIPADEKDYVHRSGRTGRAGQDGTVVTLVPDESASAVKKLQKKLGLPIATSAPDVTPAAPTGAAVRPQARPSSDRPSHHTPKPKPKPRARPPARPEAGGNVRRSSASRSRRSGRPRR
jgi:superfamily II DNA/RNA helicase